VTRALAVVALLAAVAATAAGAARHPKDPREAFTAADRAWARRVLLKPTDLPSGWRSIGGKDPAYFHCATFDPDLSDLVVTGKERSRDLARDGATAVSETTVFRSAEDAAEYWRRSPRTQLSRCYDTIYRRDLPGLRLASSRVVAAPAVGERRFALRLAWRHVASGSAPAYHLDTVAWLRGRVATFFWILDTDPIDRGLESRVARRLDARMHP
jgi:hypothetical protein